MVSKQMNDEELFFQDHLSSEKIDGVEVIKVFAVVAG